MLGPVCFIFTSELPRRLVRRGFSFSHSEIEKAVFAALRRASPFVSNFAADRRPGSRDTETGISSILCARKLFDTLVAG
jgi:hypothetical protein